MNSATLNSFLHPLDKPQWLEFKNQPLLIVGRSKSTSAELAVMLLPVLGSAQPVLGSTQLSLGSTQPFLGSTLSEPQKLVIQPSFTWVDSTFLWVNSRFSWVDSTSTWVDPLRVSREPFLSSVLSCLWVDPLRVWVDSSLGRLNFLLGRPSQCFQRTVFLSL